MRNFWLNTTKHYGKVHLLEPSRDAKHRQRMIEWYEGRGRNAALTCRHFGISRDKFYRWLGRYRQSGLGGLEDGSHRPKRVRKPTWSRELEQAVLELRRLTACSSSRDQVGAGGPGAAPPDPGLGEGQAGSLAP